MYIFGDVRLYPLRLLRNFIYACCLEIFCRRNVYFLNIALFACFIALIEVGRYKLVSEIWSVLCRPKPGDFPCYMGHVCKYCRYLLCCYVPLGRFEHSGGVASCFKCAGSGKGGIFGCRGSVGCGLC